MLKELTIVKIDKNGNGTAYLDNKPLKIAFTLPGESIKVDTSTTPSSIIEQITTSPERQQPICKYFTKCGGCNLQHWQPTPYNSWKRELLIDALSQEQLFPAIEELKTGKINARQRVTWHAIKIENIVKLGFFKKNSHEILNIEYCPITVDDINFSLPTLNKLAKILLTKDKVAIEINTTSTLKGVDIAVNMPYSITETLRQQLITFARKQQILRLTVNEELIIEFDKPIVKFGQYLVEFPSNNFLQATNDAQEYMINELSAWFKGKKFIADLFCGLGTFSLPLAAGASIDSYDITVPALSALKTASKNYPALRKVSVNERNLFNRPLLLNELQKFDGLVLDPPRAGALKQTMEIAKSTISKLAYISCNPTSLARDLAILVKGGYKIEKIVPIDQFIFSPHLETLCLLSKPAAKRKWQL